MAFPNLTSSRILVILGLQVYHDADATPNGLAMNLPILHDILCISYKDL